MGSWADRRALRRHLEAWAETKRGRQQEKLEEKCFLIHGSAQGHHVATLQPETYHLFICQFIHSFTGAGDLYCVLCTNINQVPWAVIHRPCPPPPASHSSASKASLWLTRNTVTLRYPRGNWFQDPVDTELWDAEVPYIKRNIVCVLPMYILLYT